MPLNDVPLPLTSQNLQNTQNPIRQNFLDIGSGFAVDHQAFASVNAGYHNKLTMPQQTPAPAGIASTAVLYYFTDNELYLNKNNGTAVPFTKSSQTTSGYTYLPSGILLQWASAGINDNQNPVAINFPITFPNACLQVVISSVQGTNNLVPPIVYTTGSFTTTQVSIGSKNGNSGNTSAYRYLAIGY